MSSQNWWPIESNPDVMNKYLEKLGVPAKWNIVDVLGLDDDSLEWVPRPVLAVLLLFPCSDQYQAHRDKEDQDLKENPQDISPKVFYMKQTVRNACGTMALLHSIANNLEDIQLFDGWFKQFLDDAKSLEPLAKAALLEKCEGFTNVHQDMSKEGQSTPREYANHHFISFVVVDGYLYELDGSKSFPIKHGPSSPENLLRDAAKVCREFLNRDPDDVTFSVVALTASTD